ncbi:MAG TPA: hypothetical protein DET40_15490 [Lentisphaeria bacterium]|nr:MAG: hypothetical protein A2X45_04860 [Lentisphaerae bacterium GWF2_50_93]HCE44942.1 hypothetical protein [Lentisphaeria bacterium]
MDSEIKIIIYLGVTIGTVLLLTFIPSRILKFLKSKYVGEITDESTKEQLRKSHLFSVVSAIIIIPYGIFICPLAVYFAIILTELFLKGKISW